jgi:hypothetical protein
MWAFDAEALLPHVEQQAARGYRVWFVLDGRTLAVQRLGEPDIDGTEGNP